MKTRTVGRLAGMSVLAVVVVVSLVTWLATRERLPDVIRIAASSRDSYYFAVGEALADRLQRVTGRTVEVVETAGSLDNLGALEAGEVSLAIVEASTLPRSGVGVASPLFAETVHVIARRTADVASIPDLVGRRVLLGEPGSAMREDALSILGHYRIAESDLEAVASGMTAFLTDETVDAAFVTTGLLSPYLDRVWAHGGFDLIPIEDGEAIATKHPYFFEAAIPRGLYDERPPVPGRRIDTVATTALLVVRSGETKLLVHHALEALYEGDMALKFTRLIRASEAEAWPLVPLHPFARSYFRPYEGIDLLASFMESLAATKELLFALAAGGYLLWGAYHRKKEQEDAQSVQELKDHLDAFLQQTIRIEKAQMVTDDAAALNAYLDEVTNIKLRALEELSHEDLRGDRTFLIFLTQCANLIRKIQAKIELVERRARS